MTDFVLQTKLELGIGGLTYDEFFIKVLNHAKTLKLKPELCMFVPTDENGNVLITPTETNPIYWSKQYQTALSKVWFKGFVWNTAEFWGKPMLELENKDGKYFLYDCADKNFQYLEDNFIQTLEDLTPYNIEITENFGKL